MKKRVVYVFLVLMICFIFVYIYSGLSNVQKMKVTIISSGELIEKIENRDNFTAYFFQTGCSGCDKVAPIINEYIENTNIPIYAVNLETAEYPAYLLEVLKIQSSPTIITFSSGKEIGRLSTVFSLAELEECISGGKVK